jgi:hypothetical protein
MALIKRADGTFLINQNPLQWGMIRQARSLFRVDLQRARDIAAQLRAAGIEAYASQDGGTEEDPAFKAPTAQVDFTVTWPSTWRIEVEQLSENRFVHKFSDATNVQHSVVGRTPQEVVDRLASSINFEARQYIASITPIPETPVAVLEVPVDEAPKKFLRPGSRTGTPYTPEEVRSLEAQRAFRETPKTPPIEIEYLNFFNASSSSDVAKRKKNDPQFFQWMKDQGLLFGRSEEYARN